MIALIISLIILGIGTYLFRTRNYDTLGVIIIIFTSMFLVFHVALISFKSYDFELYMARRDSFERTLNESRKSGRELEAAAMLMQVSQWNETLSVRKFNNTNLFLGQYNDNRIMDIKPIK